MDKKRRRGAPAKKLDADKVVRRAVQMATGGISCENREDLVRSDELSESVNSLLHARTGMLAHEFYDRVTAKLELLVDKLADDLLEKHDKITPNSLPVSLGIILDKVNNLKGRPQAVTANLSMGFGPKNRTREDILRILGNEEEAEKVEPERKGA